jgi:hypothetical protein
MSLSESEAYIDSDKVLQRFTHFETSNVEMPSMQEVIDPLTTVMISLQTHQPKINSIQSQDLPQIEQAHCHGAETADQLRRNEYPSLHQSHLMP